MPITAPDTRSLPQRHYGSQSENSQTRFALRTQAITDKSLSLGARVLYCLLDDYSGKKAECWPWQKTAAERIGRSVRSVKRWIAELVRSGYISIRRTQSGNRYRLSWAASVPENNAAAEVGPSEVPTPSLAYIEPRKELPVSNSNSIEALDSSGWEFGLDDAVRIFEWASRSDG